MFGSCSIFLHDVRSGSLVKDQGDQKKVSYVK